MLYTFKYVRNPFIDQSYFFLQVLVIGAGDGGVIRDVSKHPLVEYIVQCEIDEVCCLFAIIYCSPLTTIKFIYCKSSFSVDFKFSFIRMLSDWRKNIYHNWHVVILA